MPSRAFGIRLPSFETFCVALVALAFGVRLARLDSLSLWRDEMDTLVFAGREIPALLAIFTAPAENAPLYFLAMKPWIELAGTTEYALRFPSALFGAATVVPMVLIGRRLLGARTALLAGLLVAVQPFLVWYGQEARVYTLLVFLVALHAWLLLRIARAEPGRSRTPAVLVAVLGALMLPMHLLVPLFLAGNAAFVLVASGGRHWRTVLASLIPAALIAVPGALWQARVLIDGVPSLYPVVPTTDVIGRMATAVVVGPGWGGPWNGIAFFVVLVGAFFVGRSRAGLALLVWALLPLVLLLAVNERFPLFLERYLAPILVPLMLVLAGFFAGLRRPGLVLAGALSVVWLVSSLNTVALKPDLRSLGGAIQATKANPTVMVVAPWWQDSVRYYAPAATFVAVPDALAIAPGNADRLMPALLLGSDSVWLVQLEYSDWDTRGYIRNWLQQNGAVVERLQLTWASAERYRLTAPSR